MSAKFTKISEMFADLRPEDRQSVQRDEFWAAVGKSRLHRLKPDEKVSNGQVYMRVGIAPACSLLDLQLTDQLVAMVDWNTNMEVAVFDVMDVPTMEDLKSFIPGIKKVFQTPIVGVWKSGVLAETAWGASGRALIEKEKSSLEAK